MSEDREQTSPPPTLLRRLCCSAWVAEVGGEHRLTAPDSQSPTTYVSRLSFRTFAPAVATIWPSASAPIPPFSQGSCLSTALWWWCMLPPELAFHLGVYVSRLLSSYNNTKRSCFSFQISAGTGTLQHKPVGSPWTLAPRSHCIRYTGQGWVEVEMPALPLGLQPRGWPSAAHPQVVCGGHPALCLRPWALLSISEQRQKSQ